MTKFNTKETYLAYRSNWKAEYNTLSEDIREQKRYIRSQSTPSGDDYYALRTMKERATEMLEERIDSKVKAHQQYLAAKEELVAA